MQEKKGYFLIVFNACLAAFMATLDSYIVNVSLPSVARDLNITTSTVSLVSLAYLLSLTSTTLIFGKLADRVGLKTMLIAGYVLFTVASVLCGVSWTAGLLIAARFVQGVGGAMVVIAGYAIIPELVPKEIRGWAFGYLAIFAALGVTVGTPLGGIIAGYSSWHWIFLVNIPVGIAAVLIARRTLPDDSASVDRAIRTPFDVAGAVLSSLGILALVFGLNRGRVIGWTSPVILASFLFVGIALAAFIEVEKRSADPLLDLGLFKDPRFSLSLVAMSGVLLVMAGNNFLLPFYLEVGHGLKPQQVGGVLLIYSVMALLVGPNAGRASDRIRPALLCGTAMLSAAIACATFAATLHHRSLWPVIVFLFWYGVSNALFISPNNNLVMSLAPEDKKGIASGMFNMVGRLSLVLGVCVFESVFSGVVPNAKGSLMSGTVSPDTLNRGFRVVYMTAALVCFGSHVVSMLSARMQNLAPHAAAPIS